MPNVTSSDPSSAPEPLQPLIDRVRARVADANLALDRRARSTRPRSARSRQVKSVALGEAQSPTSALTPEIRSLRHVFQELGDTHRQHRRQTGEHVPPALREAALAFKGAPSLRTLVAVAAFVEEEGILAW